MKKILAIVLAAVMLLSMTACGAAAKKDTYVVGICQLVQHDALDAATKGFQDALTEALGDKVKFEVQNASGDSVNCTTIINGFVSSNVDLILANATAVKMYNESVCQQLGLTMPEDYSPIAAD